MLNDLSRLLLRTRIRGEWSARQVAARAGVNHQTVSKYEQGILLPEERYLGKLARGYKIELEVLEAAYRSSQAQALVGAITADTFTNVLESIVKDDHAVVIAQTALIPDAPEFADIVAGILARGAAFTWVAYMPPQGFGDSNREWESNHHLAANILLKGLRSEGISLEEAQHQYLLIGKATENDYAYLRADGGTVYIARRAEADYQAPLLWSQMRAADGQRWWLLRDDGYRLKVHDWLAYSCGLDLPGLKTPPKAPRAKQRQLRRVTLDEFLN